MKIVFFCGSSVEDWSPKSAETGIGGSEEATIYLSKELAKLGHDVTVYNQIGKDSGTYDGVKWKSHLQYAHDECDVLIIWRSPTLDEEIRESNAKLTTLWLHDTVSQDSILPYVHFLDQIMVLSNYHAGLYPKIPQDKLFRTQNGVELSQFDAKVKRIPHKMIWTSSYDRGLKELLEEWTTIKLAVPEAELHIFYGWETMDKGKGSDDESYQIFKEYMEELFDQEGVHEHGRVSHKRIAKEMLSSGVWPYPTWWPEISCISAMKAQIAGAIPVVIPTAAVAETTRWGLTTNWSYDHFRGNNLPEKVMEKFSDQVIKALDPDFQDEIRGKMMTDARNRFNWKGVAKEWSDKFKQEIRRKDG